MKTRQIIGAIIMAVIAIIFMIYRFEHIDYTSMRVAVNLWYLYIPLIIGVVLFYKK